jgi:hypothetical protein
MDRGESPFLRPGPSKACVGFESKPMIKQVNATGKVLPFVTPQSSHDGKLEKWFRGVIQSNQDLMTALERLRDSYQALLKEKPFHEADQAVLLAVQITLNDARKARLL